MIKQMPKYESYKDSGVEWLGEIPEHWSLIPNKRIFKLKKKLVGKRSSEYDLLSLTLKGIVKRDMDNPEGKFPAEFDTYQEVSSGDFVFCLFDVEETPRTVGLSKFDGMITGAYAVFNPSEQYSREFLYYFYLNLDTGKKLKPLYKGLRNTISKEAFFSFKTFVPPIDEQVKIASYLDKKTSQIDEAIAIKQKQIELLKERKKVIIQQAVTQGLNPDVPMKDSGVDWIGEIPEHWDTKKLKFVSHGFMYGTSVDCNSLESGTPVLRIPNIDEITINLSDLKYANLSSDETKKYSLSKNDILIIRTNGNPALVGKSAIVDADDLCLFASYLIKLTPKSNIEPSFLIRTMNSFSVRGALTYSARTSAGNYNLNTQALGDCHIAFPPREEQIQIADLVDRVSAKTDQSLALVTEQIAKLKEYKNTLINSAVTGKIKVTELA
ncbi:restriction endonuclease subunit S [Vibrio toranzoniae]|uniref:restriction endonuclease subunit S n=1 Tax=Vibrio toranzoniae TaxID=1194427 RepID=UPI001378181A|nr:restriction endonuclease subunit S [Vibrio toranzoniae]NAZ94022.1 restriction endonuclease subunit S [Vibrio toranzoniae]